MDMQFTTNARPWRHFSVSVAALLVVVIVFLSYLPTLENGFVNYDDLDYIVNNAAIRSLDSDLLRWSFWGFHFQFYIPFAWLSFALDHYFWGLDPKGYHLANNILHALNAGWVMLLSRELFEVFRARKQHDLLPEQPSQAYILLVCVTAGLLFGLHPLRVESVAWATERKDVLSAFFALPTLIAYLRFAGVRSGEGGIFRGKWYTASVIFFLFSLLSKPMMVTMPAVLLLLDWYPLGRLTRKDEVWGAIKEKIPFIGLSFIFLVLVLMSQLADGASIERVSLTARLLLSCKSIISYLWMMVWPAGLVPLYPHPGNEASIDQLGYVFSLFAVFSISAATLTLALKDDGKWLWGWGYFLITLLPVLGITQVGPQAMADRFTYIPVIIPTILITMLLSRIQLDVESGSTKRAVAVGFLVIIFSLVLGAYGAISRNLMAVWHDSGTLWSRVIAVRPMESADAYHHRGYFYADKGEYARALEDMDKSVIVAGLKQPHNLPYAYLGRGDILMKMGRYQEAYDDFSRGIAAGSTRCSELQAAQLAARNLLVSGRKYGPERQ